MIGAESVGGEPMPEGLAHGFVQAEPLRLGLGCDLFPKLNAVLDRFRDGARGLLPFAGAPTAEVHRRVAKNKISRPMVSGGRGSDVEAVVRSVEDSGAHHFEAGGFDSVEVEALEALADGPVDGRLIAGAFAVVEQQNPAFGQVW